MPPPVKTLVYQIDHGNGFDFKDAKRLRKKTARFTVTAENKSVRFDLTPPLKEEHARKIADQFVRNWEFSANLANGPDCFHLKSPRAEYAESSAFHLALSEAVGSTPPLKLQFPKPPSDIKVTPDVRSVFDRYMRYRQGGERLDSMAYFCLTVLEAVASQERGEGGGKPKAAKVYGVSQNVLKMIGRLSSSHGRKAHGRDDPLDPAEERFLEAAASEIICRMAEQALDPDAELPKITMAHLPPLRASNQQL